MPWRRCAGKAGLPLLAALAARAAYVATPAYAGAGPEGRVAERQPRRAVRRGGLRRPTNKTRPADAHGAERFSSDAARLQSAGAGSVGACCDDEMLNAL